MTLFLLLLLLSLTCALLVGFSLQTLVLGFILSVGVLWLLPQLPAENALPIPSIKNGRRLARFLWNGVVFFMDFLWDLTVSNLQLAADIWTPKDHYTPILVHVPIGDLTDFQIAFLASRITLTPGTLSAEISADRKVLVVHTMYPGTGDIAGRLRRPIEILSRGL